MTAHTDGPTQDRLIYVQWSDDGEHIRKWAREPFVGATAFANAGNGAPLGPYDASEHCLLQHLPLALRDTALNIHVQCAPHVLEDMVRIVTDAADYLECYVDMLAALIEAKGLADMAVMSDDLDGTPSEDQAALVSLRAKIDAAIAKAKGLPQ